MAAGEDLVVTDHYAEEEVKEKMEKLETDRDALLKLWEDRRISYEQCMDLMLFYRGMIAIRQLRSYLTFLKSSWLLSYFNNINLNTKNNNNNPIRAAGYTLFSFI